MSSSKQSSRETCSLMAKWENGDQLEAQNLKHFSYLGPNSVRRKRSYLIVILCALGLFSLLVIFAHNAAVEKALFFKIVPAEQGRPQESCIEPSIRREWRSLSESDQLRYIAAVQCLRDKPSQLGLNQTLYDDFPWTHSRIGNYSHKAAPFLSWHRYFIHVYEITLQEQCGYNGSLVYWDWSLDWEDLTLSPIWDSDVGFGGNGNSSDEKSVAYGYCVTDGPFARLTALIWGVEDKPHCLSRGFAKHEKVKKLGLRVSPEALEKMLEEPDYDSFNIGLELGPHNAIPNTVRGDFYRVTAPYDPIFFLHHAALDRMWWMWQQMDLSQRLIDYGGKAGANSTVRATLSDLLQVSDLAPAVKVSEVMNTESTLLCYRY